MEVREVRRRRRGATLDEAVLEGAWAEILERGYSGFKVDAVARRAETSKAVLYRRWPDKQALARAAIDHFLEQKQTLVPNTGSLRSDVIELLLQFSERRSGIATQVVASLAEFYRDTGTSLGDLRNGLVGRQGSSMTQVIERAIERGEVNRDTLTDRIVSLPADLLRGEILMTSQPVTEADIVEIVDTIFLPLATGRSHFESKP